MNSYLNRLKTLFWLFLWSMLFYLYVRVEFLLWNNVKFKTATTVDILKAFLLGIRFDVAAVAFVLSPIILLSLIPWYGRGRKAWQIISYIAYLIVAGGFLIMNMMDLEFINFSGRRFTFDALFILGEAPGRIGGFISTYWWMFILNSMVFLFFAWGAWKIFFRRQEIPAEKHSWLKNAVLIPLLCLAVIAGTVTIARGGLQRKPLNIVSAHVFPESSLNNLILNSTFTFLISYGAETVAHDVYFTNREDMLKYMNGSVQAPSLMEGHRPTTPQNIVIIILESFGLEYMGEINGDKGYTPFLDSLARKSLFFKNGFANGRRSIEGVPAVLAGVPTMMNDAFISSPFSANHFVGLGSYLKQKGYSTSFFHGGHNGTMYFDTFAKSAGQDHYFGFNEVPDSAKYDDGSWGIYDEPFYHFMVTQLNAQPQPFMASVFSLSSHQPYRIPDEYKGKFPKGSVEILESVGYADYSLQKFFEEAAKQPWYDHTLFVITADHTSLAYRPDYLNEISRYRVPILFFHPHYEWPAGIDRDEIVQQIDIMPSILDFLGIKTNEVNYMARSAFVPGERSATTYLDNRYLLVMKDYYLDWFRGGPMKMYSRQDAMEKQELTEPAAVKIELEQRLKASVQYFNEAMWNDRLYYPLH